MTRREASLSGLGSSSSRSSRGPCFARQIVFPKPEDTAYYVGVARNLVDGRGLVSDALWSYQTPPLVVPATGLRGLAAAADLPRRDPDGHRSARRFAAAQVSSVLIGALVPVLAWRLAADVAAERGLPAGRARTLAIGTGLTTAVYLPLVLHSALPDSTMPFTVLALAACLLMTRHRARSARRPAHRPAVIGLGVAHRPDRAHPQRGGLAGPHLGDRRLARRRPRPSRAVRTRLIGVAGVVAFLVFAPWVVARLARLRQSAAGSGGGQRPVA